jgi:predicted nuclease of predicted toxin-antitoxin system
MARFYLNENIAASLAGLLGQNGHDVLTTQGAGKRGAGDEAQLDYATENDRILLTHNRRDFRQIHRRQQFIGKRHRGVILLGEAEPEVLIRRIQAFVDHFDTREGNFCELAEDPPQHHA